MSFLGEIFDLLTFWRKEKRETERAFREARASERDEKRLATERQQRAIEGLESLRDNLKYRLESDSEPDRKTLEDRLRATEATLTQLYADVAFDDPGIRYYFAENMRTLVPREIAPAGQLPEPARETAGLLEAAREAADATPVDAEDHFLRANALYFRSEQLEGRAIAQALREAVEASDQALEVYTGDHYPFYHALVGGNREQARRLLDERTY